MTTVKEYLTSQKLCYWETSGVYSFDPIDLDSEAWIGDIQFDGGGRKGGVLVGTLAEIIDSRSEYCCGENPEEFFDEWASLFLQENWISRGIA